MAQQTNLALYGNAALYEVTPIRDLQEMLRNSVEEFGERTAFLTKPERGKPYVPVTYKQYGADVVALGNQLWGELEQRGDARIAILAETCYPWYVSYLATVNGEAVVVPLDKELPPAEIRQLLMRAEVTTLIYSAQLKEKVQAALAEGDVPPHLRYLVPMDMDAIIPQDELHEQIETKPYLDLLTAGHKQVGEGIDPFSHLELDPEIMRILLFTSGTTSKSKAVMHNHRSIVTNLMAMCQMTFIGKDDVFLSVLPIHHTYECTCGFLCPIYRGASVAQVEGLRYISQNLAESKATVILVVPLLAETLHKRITQKINSDPKQAKKVRTGVKLTRGLRKVGIDLRRKVFKAIIDGLGGHLRLFISGGAYVNPQILDDFNDWGILGIQGYGLTECAPILALNRDIYHKSYSAGLPLPGVDVKIVDKDEEGVGEIIGKGNNVMLGYYQDEELTAESIKDGYYYTGDLGYKDDDGFIIITGRKKNVIVTDNGKNIYPEEIESILNEHPLITESVISGQADQRGKDVITAEIFPDEEAVKEALGGRDGSDEEIYDLLMDVVRETNKTLVSYKTIRQLIVRTDEFEKNTSRKIMRDYSTQREGISTAESDSEN